MPPFQAVVAMVQREETRRLAMGASRPSHGCQFHLRPKKRKQAAATKGAEKEKSGSGGDPKEEKQKAETEEESGRVHSANNIGGSSI